MSDTDCMDDMGVAVANPAIIEAGSEDGPEVCPSEENGTKDMGRGGMDAGVMLKGFCNLQRAVAQCI